VTVTNPPADLISDKNRALVEMTRLRDRVALIAAKAILWIGVPVITSFSITDFRLSLAWSGALLFTLLGISIGLIQRGFSLQGRLLIVGTIATALLGRAIVFGGVNSVPYVGWVVVVILSAILISGRTAWLTAIFGVAAGGLLYSWEINGQLPEAIRPNTPLTALRISSALFLITALLSSTLSRQMKTALERVVNADIERINLLDRFRLAARGAQFGIWDLDLKKSEIWLGPGLLSILGKPGDPVVVSSADFQALMHPDDRLGTGLYRTENIEGVEEDSVSDFRVRHTDGHWVWVQSRGRIVPPTAGKSPRMVGSLMNIETNKALENALTQRANYDSLTGLLNRQSFLDNLNQALEDKRADEKLDFAVLFLDLDRFKTINDSLGHSLGDRLLQLLAQRLDAVVSRPEAVARIGGDQFTALLRDLTEADEVHRIAQEVAEAVTQCFLLADREIYLKASIGVVAATTDHMKAEDLLRDANLAMSSVKSQATKKIGNFDLEMRHSVQALMKLDTELRRGVTQKEFIPWYQPIVDLSNGQLVGVEALARWRQPDGSIWHPGRFIGRAEETGWVLALDRQIIEQAVADIADFGPIILSVNLSAHQLTELAATDWLFHVIERCDFPPERLQVEITETILLTDLPGAREALSRLKSRGVRVALDDFGTGYSSLTYVHTLDPQILKIDISFVQELGDTGPGPICETIVSVADKLGLGTSAEGIETETQRSSLISLGCRYGQGYLFGRPVPFDELREADWSLIPGY